MPNPESIIMKQVQLEAPKCGAVLLRFNNGLYWAGTPKKIQHAGQYFLPAGTVVLYDGRPVKTGPPGISDQLGWTRRAIRPEDVGRTLAIFTAVECKTDTGRVTPEQQAFLDAVNAAGGLGLVARSAQDLRTALL